MDRYSQRAHDNSCRVARKLTQMKEIIPKHHFEQGKVPKVLVNSKIIAKPYKEYLPKLDKLRSNILELR
jgi:hypothetical protein